MTQLAQQSAYRASASRFPAQSGSAASPRTPPALPSESYPVSLALEGMVGRYAFSLDATAEILRKGSALEIELIGHANSSNYLSVGHPALLTGVATDEFEIAGPREDRLHIDRDAHGAIIGITINPGLWPVHATRK
ncbi:MAG: hypothetical protein ABSF72_15260 [Candidatus Sulfotelmatobacter sp.]